MSEPNRRLLPIGCEVLPEGTHFRVWAPAAKTVDVVGRDTEGSHRLEAEPWGYFSALLPIGAGAQYKFSLDHSDDLLPDPASRCQPEGPFGWSQVVDSRFAWTDENWTGASLPGQIVYEMHIGTFTPQGTWAAAGEQIPELADTGITVIEVMPVADYPGRFGWGYDGVNLFAPSRLYGSPDDFRRFIDKAHAHGIAVILDVVYNHIGPAGNFLARFAPRYFQSERKTEWGDAINFDGEDSEPVREYFLANAAYWISEFHLDGLRLDATQAIFDRGTPHILSELEATVRAAAKGRDTILIGENEPQERRLLVPPGENGIGLDGVWNDDFHHSAMVALTGRREAYYTDYTGHAHEFLSAVKHGYLYQGQHYSWQKQTRGQPCLDVPAHRFVLFLQNHDQIANSVRGWRAHRLTSPGRWRALTALLLLAPGTPMLFQGQEFSASAPFFYFADHEEELSNLVASGRVEFLSQFASLEADSTKEALHKPGDLTTFEQCKLDFAERERNTEIYALHKALIHRRRTDPVLRKARIDGSAWSQDLLLIRYFGENDDDRLLLLNLGADLQPRFIPDPLIAPPVNCTWEPILSTEDVRFGGGGLYHPCSNGQWRIPGEAAVLLAAHPSKR